MAIGDTVNGEISSADCRSRYRVLTTDGTFYADLYSFNFTAGQQITFTAVGNLIMPYLYLTDQNGAVLAERGGRDVRLPAGTDFLTLPATGTYFLEVTTESSSNVSGYMLRLLTPTSCAYSLTPVRQTFEPAGVTDQFNVVSGGSCAWTATSAANCKPSASRFDIL